MANVKVQQEWLWIIISSGYKHEKKGEKNIIYLSKTKMHKRELILEAVHRIWTAQAI